jgi:exodeoxyribonuclease V gamma subunit
MNQLHVHRGNRMERLAGVLVERLAGAPPPDPMTPVRIVVGSRGMARWLRNLIADRLGVCANVAFPFPAPFISEVLSDVLGDATPQVDPWSPEALAWSVLDVLPELLGSEAFAPVARYLRGWPRDGRPVDHRAFALARQIADLLDRYVHLRRDWIAAWEGGPAPRDLPTDDLDARWQRALWRALVARIGAPHLGRRVTRFERALARPADSRTPGVSEVHVFGLSSLPSAWLDVLSHLALRARVDLYLLAPSDRYWVDFLMREEVRACLRTRSASDLAEREEAFARQNPILTSLGRVSRDLQGLLEALPPERYYQAGDDDLFEDPRPPPSLGEPPRLLHQLQADLRELSPAFDPRRPLRAEDDSLRVHACHGPTRQVEVLRDVLLGLFDDDPTLEPRDVLVMTPDIEAYAPLVAATLTEGRRAPRPIPGGAPGAIDWGAVGAPSVPIEIADRPIRETNPVADLVLRVLDLAEARVTASAVADLLALDPVRHRFDLSDQDVVTLRRFIRDAGIRWGLDPADRARADQPAEEQNTWRFGLDRLALGALMDEDEGPFGGCSPVAPGGADELALLGRFAAFCAALFEQVEALRAPRPYAAWARALLDTADSLCDVSDRAGWLREEVAAQLEDLSRAAAGFDEPLDLGAARRSLAGRFEVASGGDRPISHAVTVCALQPMRSVPFRVICLLGMDDDAFPRSGRHLGFDLTRRAPRLGDHDARDEDRHLLLEAILSARARLHVFYTGRDPRSNEPIAPAVPIGELLDRLERSFEPPPGAPSVRALVHVAHPVQPFSPGNFSPRSDGFDARMARAATALARARTGRQGLFELDERLEDADGPADVHLDDLAALLLRPTRALLNRSLGLYLQERDEALADREPVEVAGLDRWRLDDEILRAALAQDPTGARIPELSEVARDLRARGLIPLGTAGRGLAEERLTRVSEVLGEARAVLAGAGPVDVELRLADGTRLAGRIPRVDPNSGALVDVQTSSPEGAGRLIRAWVRLLALQAREPRQARRAVLVGAAQEGAAQVHVQGPRQDEALARLGALVDLYREGLRRPILLFEGASRAFAARASGFDPDDADGAGWASAEPGALARALEAARACWAPEAGVDDRWGADRADPHVAAVFPDEPPFERDAAARDEFVRWAEILWRPLLAGASSPDPQGGGS